MTYRAVKVEKGPSGWGGPSLLNQKKAETK